MKVREVRKIKTAQAQKKKIEKMKKNDEDEIYRTGTKKRGKLREKPKRKRLKGENMKY